MFTVLLVCYLLAAIAIIGLVLIQHGKGADMGASFGAGASNTVFGAGGSGNFLTRMTTIFAIVFLGISLVLGNLCTHKTESKWADPSAGKNVTATQTSAKQTDSTKTLPAKGDSNTSSNEIPE